MNNKDFVEQEQADKDDNDDDELEISLSDKDESGGTFYIYYVHQNFLLL